MNNNDSSRSLSSGFGTSQESFDSDHLTRLTEALRDAVSAFNGEATPENFAKIVTALGAYGLTGAKAWSLARDYTRQHPIRVALGFGLFFYALKGLFSPVDRAIEKASVYH